MDLERGPRYDEYANLRETKLRMNHLRLQQYQQQQQFEQKIPTPPTKELKFQVGLPSIRKGSSSSSSSSSLIAQSVPDFSSLLRKENRKPTTNTMPPLTPPPLKNKNKGYGVLSSSKGKNGSCSANAAEKKKGGGGILMARKSYANFDELRSFSSVTANAINGENKNSRVVGNRTVLRCREL